MIVLRAHGRSLRAIADKMHTKKGYSISYEGVAGVLRGRQGGSAAPPPAALARTGLNCAIIQGYTHSTNQVPERP